MSAGISRRAIVTSFAAMAVVGGGVFAARWFNVAAQAGQDGSLSVSEAHKAAMAGEITLIDIRRPDEWRRTGVGQGAVPINMLDADFLDKVAAQLGGARGQPVALICARGVRSRAMAARLAQAGFSTVIDVPEGMFGSGAGPGWLKQGLPVVAWP